MTKTLLEVLQKQKDYFIRNTDGDKIITNHLLYYYCEEELAEIQRKIGRENKRKIIAECKEKGLKIPNFRKEGKQDLKE